MDRCKGCGREINKSRNPGDKPSARIICDDCYNSSRSLSDVTPPLLVIEVKDLNSLPVIKLNGKDVSGLVEVSYLWSTKDGLTPGRHEYAVEHGDLEQKPIPIIKTVKEQRMH